MGSGTRNTFTEFSDGLLGYEYDDLGYNMVQNRRRRKKTKRSRRKVYTASRKKRKRVKHYQNTKRSGKKRKGMSAAFLKNLRRKHHLGEFKK